MKKVVGAVLFACVSVGLLLAHSSNGHSESVADILKQMTQDWENATQSRDVERVSQIEADDLRMVGSNGEVWTKENDLDGLKSATVKHVQAEFGPVDVKTLGDDVAVVQGTLTDKSAAEKSVYAYMDVWVKRGDKWMVVRSMYLHVK